MSNMITKQIQISILPVSYHLTNQINFINSIIDPMKGILAISALTI
jgi:hypothetical protein